MHRLRNQKGFTLLEIVFVIAIIAVIASILLPLGFSALQDADLAKADADIQEIAAGLTLFFNHVRHFAACDSGTDCTNVNNAGNNLTFLGTFSNGTTTTALFPAVGATTWVLTTEADADRNNAFNHIVINDPSGNGTAGEATLDYQTSLSSNRRWKGPYIARMGLDPWGRSYIAHVGAMEESGCPVLGAASTSKGWILSGGPNGTLETNPDATTLGGDDRGFIFQTASTFDC